MAIVHSGHIQEKNNSTSHLSRYAYMYADPVTNTDGTVNFQFRHLSSILNFLIDAPAAATYTELRVKAKEGEVLSIFATMLPWDYELTDSKLLVTLTGSEENEYTFSTGFGKVQAGKGYKLYCETSPLTTTFTSVLDLKSAIEKAGFTASTIYGLRILTCTEGEGGILVNGDLPDEEPLYVWTGLPRCPMLVTKAQKIKLPQYCTRLLNYESLSVAGMVDWTAENIDASQVISLEGMFLNCSSMEGLYLPEEFSTSNVTDMSYMFCGCNKVPNDRLKDFDTSSLVNASNMFGGAKSTNSYLDLRKWNVRKVEDMSYMFYNYSFQKIQTDGWMTNVNTD